MDNNEFIKKENIILELKGDSKVIILEEMLESFIQSGDVFPEDKEILMHELLEREAKGSTAIGNHIAIPHCKTILVDKIIAVVALKKTGLDFQAVDNKPVNIFILTLSPKKSSSSHIQFLALISNIFQDEKNRQEIQQLETQIAIYEFILKKGYLTKK